MRTTEQQDVERASPGWRSYCSVVRPAPPAGVRTNGPLTLPAVPVVDQPVRRTGLTRRPCAARARPEEPAWTAPLGALLPARPRRAARLAGAAAASAGFG